jgi:hypothetical protein
MSRAFSHDPENRFSGFSHQIMRTMARALKCPRRCMIPKVLLQFSEKILRKNVQQQSGRWA